MGFKSIFLNVDDEKPPVVQQTQESKNSFPAAAFPTTFPTQESTPMPNIQMQGSNEFLASTIAMYEKGFSDLNIPGADFYEFYQAVIKGGINNPSVYEMALSMLSTMDSKVTKSFLLDKSEYYINEITKVYNGYVSSGNAKKQQLLQERNTEESNLKTDVDALTQQIAALNTQLSLKQSSLNDINVKYQPMVAEIELKLQANDTAKNSLLSSITQVKNGIISNLK